MPDNPHAPTDADPQTEITPAGVKRSSIFRAARLLGMVGLVVALECGIALFWLPSVSESEAKEAAGVQNPEDVVAESLLEGEAAGQVEIDMGQYTVTAYQPASSTTMRIDFHLYGVIDEKENEEFLTLKESNDARVREQINVIVRGSTVSDLTDPGLGLIKRRILEKTNRILGKPLLRGVIFSDFSFLEQ